jgi:predicted aspartyl protease
MSSVFRHILVGCSVLFLIAPARTFAQEPPSCASPDWFVNQRSDANGERLSPLCKGELYAAEDNRSAAERELKALIQTAPASATAYQATSTLSHFYLRVGRFRDAEAQILSMLAQKPTAPDLQNIQPLFALLAQYPDLTVTTRHPATINTEIIDGNVFAPVRINDSRGVYMLDTGLNLSIMTESEAARFGLTPHSSTTRLSDISGSTGAALKVVEADDLIVAHTHLRHVPFLVVSDTNGAFVGLAPDHRGILGIQPLLALGTLGFYADGRLQIGGEAARTGATEPLLFDGAMPITQIAYQGKELTVTLDVGATQTTLNPLFAKNYPELISRGNKEIHDLNGLSGTTALHSVSLPYLDFTFGREVHLAPATILLDQTTGSSSWTVSNLGYDVMQQARPFVIDFRHMKITFGNEH